MLAKCGYLNALGDTHTHMYTKMEGKKRNLE